MSKSKKSVLSAFIRQKVEAAIAEHVAMEVRLGNLDAAKNLAANQVKLSCAIAGDSAYSTYAMLELQDIMDWRFRRARGQGEE